MPAGILIPATHMQSMIGGGRSNGTAGVYGSASGLTLSSQPDRMDGQQQNEEQNEMNLQFNSQTSVLMRGRNDEIDNKSSSENNEGGSGDDQDSNSQRPNKKKRYHRHTQHQIQEMEAFFKECPHPDDKHRKELSRELGLEPLQVKFWFQNKRTQMKTQHERSENSQLRAENEKLRIENMRYKEALSNASCPNCGGPATLGEMSYDEHHLRIENVRLREEIDRITGIAAKYVGGRPSMVNYPMTSPQMGGRVPSLDLGVGSSSNINNNSGHLGGIQQHNMVSEMFGGDTHEADKPMMIEVAVTAMEELIRMAQLRDPLWVLSPDNSTEILNQDVYFRTFPRGIGPAGMGMKSEASRDSAVVIMNHLHLVEMLMDANQWSTVFSWIVSRAVTVEVLSTGVGGNYNGALQVMSAEFQVPSPLVPTRENYFIRYCKHHSDGIWAVVDVSLDHLRPDPMPKSRRRPSGCLIQEMPNGYSKVTWVEHVEVDDRSVHDIYKAVVNSGIAFGAKRWVATLDRQCERLASVMASNTPSGDIGVITSQEARKSMLKLAERMVISFCNGVSASTTHQWTTLSGSSADDVRVMTRKSIDDPGRPPGIVLSAATSFWIPVPPKRVFEFLRDENSRSEWDILSNGSVVQEMAHIANGREQGNCVSLLRVNSANSNQSNMLILQESCTDSTGAFVIYAPVDIVAMNVVLNGGDPDYVALLPSGFAILPDGPLPPAQQSGSESSRVGDIGTGGSLLTVAFQILVDSVPTAKLSLSSVATVNSLISCTVERIKAAVTFPHFNSALFPHKPPLPANANRVLFTESEDRLLAMGLMECNNDWAAIQIRFLPCKSKHQIFIRQKNRSSSKSPENPIKTVRHMKTSPLTVPEVGLISRGLKLFKNDLNSVWRYFVPYRDPSLLPRQWRIATGTQKSYRKSEALKEKRRAYEANRRKRKAGQQLAWEKEIDDSQNYTNNIYEDDEPYVHEAFLAEPESMGLKFVQTQTNQDVLPYQMHKFSGIKVVKLAPGLPPVNLPSSVRIISQSAFKNHCGVSSYNIVGGRDSKLLPSLYNNNKPGGSLRNSRSLENIYSDKNPEDCLQNPRSGLNRYSTEENCPDSEVHMHPLLFRASENVHQSHHKEICSVPALKTSNFPSGHQNGNTDLFYPTKHSKELLPSDTIDFHPLLQRMDNRTEVSVNDPEVNLASRSLQPYVAKCALTSYAINGVSSEPHTSFEHTGPSTASTSHYVDKNNLDSNIHLTPTNKRKTPNSSMKTFHSNGISLDDPLDGTMSIGGIQAQSPCREKHSEANVANLSSAHIVKSCNQVQKISKTYVGHSYKGMENVEDEHLTGIVMEQEELSDSDDENEHIEFEREEMEDSEGEQCND